MTKENAYSDFCKHQWPGKFLSGRFKVRAWPESFGPNTKFMFEWAPGVPWEVRMTTKAKRKFYPLTIFGRTKRDTPACCGKSLVLPKLK